MECKAQVVYDHNIWNLARLYQAKQKEATLKHRYKD